MILRREEGDFEIKICVLTKEFITCSKADEFISCVLNVFNPEVVRAFCQ